jgi:hypothetical protein
LLLAALPYAKRLELEARTPDARYASIAGIALAVAGCEALTGRTVEPAAIGFPLEGRPHFARGPDFSIAHTDGWVGCAVAAHGTVGLDVEAVTRSRPVESLERWTAVEAVLKASGAGLRHARAVDLDPVQRRGRFAGRSFFLQALALGTGLVAHLATETADCAVDLCEVRVDDVLARVAQGVRSTEIARSMPVASVEAGRAHAGAKTGIA